MQYRTSNAQEGQATTGHPSPHQQTHNYMLRPIAPNTQLYIYIYIYTLSDTCLVNDEIFCHSYMLVRRQDIHRNSILWGKSIWFYPWNLRLYWYVALFTKNQFATELLLCVIWMPKSNLSEEEQLTKQVFFFVIHHTSKRWFQYSQGRTCPWPLYKLSALPKHLIINSVIDFWGCKYDNAEYDAHWTCLCIQNGWRWNAPSYHTTQCLICKHG